MLAASAQVPAKAVAFVTSMGFAFAGVWYAADLLADAEDVSRDEALDRVLSRLLVAITGMDESPLDAQP